MDAKWNTIRNKWKHQKISIIQTKNTTNKYSRPNKTKSRPQINQERYMGWEMDYRNAIHPYKLLFKRINMVICSLVHGRKSSLCIVMNHTFGRGGRGGFHARRSSRAGVLRFRNPPLRQKIFEERLSRGLYEGPKFGGCLLLLWGHLHTVHATVSYYFYAKLQQKQFLINCGLGITIRNSSDVDVDTKVQKVCLRLCCWRAWVDVTAIKLFKNWL